MPSTLDVVEITGQPRISDDLQPRSAADSSPAARGLHSLAELQRLAELLAVEDGYAPAHRDFVIPRNFMLSVVIPVHNGEATIRHVISHVAALPVPKEIIVVDDASTDGTRGILNEFECAQNVHLIFKPHNEGYGAALRTGFRRVSGDVVVMQAADRQYDPRDILPVIKPIVCGLADAVYGSRFIEDSPPSDTWLQSRCRHGLTGLFNWATGLSITDLETGCKAFRREVLQELKISQPGSGFDPEITARLARQRVRLYEVPLSHASREPALARPMRFRQALAALYCILRYAWLD